MPIPCPPRARFAARVFPLFALCIPLAASVAPAQCPDAHWLPGNALPGVTGTVSATGWWDPDGPGPTPAYPVVAGDFTISHTQSDIGGTVFLRNLAAWNPASSGGGGRWIPLLPTGLDVSTPVSGGINAFATLPNGDLVAAGTITNIGGTAVTNIARWNGTAWSPMGSGLNGQVTALAVLNNGDLVAGGSFSASGATNVGKVARWNGTAWSAFAATGPASVNAMCVTGDGTLVVAGPFANPNSNVNYWSGTAWAPLPNNQSFFNITCMAAVPGTSSQFVMGGAFFDILGTTPFNLIVKWTGGGWAGLGGGLGHNTGSEIINSIAVRPNGEVIAGGQFTMSRAFGTTPVNNAVQYIASWNGVEWSAMNGGANSFVNSLRTLPDGRVLAGGNASGFGGQGSNGVALWDGAWSALGNGFGGVRAMIELPDVPGQPTGQVLMGGADPVAGGITVNRIARFDGTRFNALGTGANLTINAVARLNNGNIVAGGDFTQIGPAAVGRIAQFNGTTWIPIGGSGLNGGGLHINALCVSSTGGLIAAGLFPQVSGVNANNVARWDGNAWLPMGTGANSEVYSAIALPNGDVVIGGAFNGVNGVPAPGVARWNGITQTWSAMGNGPGGFAYGLARCANGDILACGDFSVAVPAFRRYRVARWNGSTWTPLGSESAQGVAVAYAVIERPDGSIVVGGNFLNSNTGAGGTPVSTPNIARWDGNTWSGLERGVAGHVRVLMNHSNGELWAGGLMSYANRIPNLGWARFSACSASTCGADLDDGTGSGNPDGAVTIDDLIFMLIAFENGDLQGDVDDDGDPAQGHPDGAVTIEDLIYMLNHFETGC